MGTHSTSLKPTSAVLTAAVVIALALSGCSTGVAVTAAESETLTPTRPSADPAAGQKQNLRRACASFQSSMNTFSNASRIASEAESVEDYASALQELSYSLGDQALDAGDTGDAALDLALAHLATEVAGFADEYLVTRESSTSRWLAFRTGVKAVADPCGQTWNFAE